MACTFEEKLMFDSGLPVGVSLVKLVKGQAEATAAWHGRYAGDY